MTARAADSERRWADALAINPSQLGGIETATLDDGPGRGTRVAWVNTGGGLRYKVVIDRGLDIADAEYLGESLTWHSMTGVTSPSVALHRGAEWLGGFYGGLVVSCGPLNVGTPCEDQGVVLPLHGTHSNTPASVQSIVNPSPADGRLEMSITGQVRTAKVFGPNVEMVRTISSSLGEPVIRIRDAFVNRGNETVEHGWLLHINFGWPLLEPGASVLCYRGQVTPRSDSVEHFTTTDHKRVPRPMESHRGGGEDCAYIDHKVGRDGMVCCGVVNEKRGRGVMIEYPKAQFPRMVNWQHWGPGGSFVSALEPCNGGVEGRDVDRQRGWLDFLEPGESREYDCTITATADRVMLDRLLSLNR